LPVHRLPSTVFHHEGCASQYNREVAVIQLPAMCSIFVTPTARQTEDDRRRRSTEDGQRRLRAATESVAENGTDPRNTALLGGAEEGAEKGTDPKGEDKPQSGRNYVRIPKTHPLESRPRGPKKGQAQKGGQSGGTGRKSQGICRNADGKS
jgi:hypothetical protein